MDVRDAISSSRSIRMYADKPVEEEKLDRILEAARLAPSASNRQERRFIIVRDAETRKKLAKAACNQGFVGTAPVVIAACATVFHRTASPSINSCRFFGLVAASRAVSSAITPACQRSKSAWSNVCIP